jgi:hypothetical protein
VVTAWRRSLLLAAGLFAGCATPAFEGPITPPTVARIAILANTPTQWIAAYRLPAPVTELIFMRQPDDSRTKDWKPARDFEIVRTGGAERLRRKDGAPFDHAQVDVPAAYRDLPMDYAPFSPFGDGGMLAYSGRFFACPTECADSAEFQMQLTAPGHTILVDGKRHDGNATWTDTAEGRSVYVGETAPVETPDFLAVIDNALPPTIQAQLAADLPGFMHFFADRMGALPERPMLFASYDIRPTDGFGRQGGTLPGQVFVHFYGEAWPREMAKPGFTADLAWHFAHEAAHLYQHQIFADTDDAAWIHEGGAEAFAAIAMRAQGQAAGADAHIASSAAECAKRLGARSIHTALNEGEYRVAYACGLQLNLALDAELRRAAPASDGLFTVWRRYQELVKGRTPTEDDFLAAIAVVGNADIAARVSDMIGKPSPVFAFAASGGGDGQW